jgi:hypothetical protein
MLVAGECFLPSLCDLTHSQKEQRALTMNANLNDVNFCEVTRSEMSSVEGGFLQWLVPLVATETVKNASGAVARLVKDVAGIDLK